MNSSLSSFENVYNCTLDEKNITKNLIFILELLQRCISTVSRLSSFLKMSNVVICLFTPGIYIVLYTLFYVSYKPKSVILVSDIP